MSSYLQRKEKGSVLVMAVVLSFSLFIAGLGFLSSVDYLEKSVGQEISTTQGLYSAAAINRITNTIVQTGGIYPGRYGVWNEFYDNVWNRSYVGFTGSMEDDFFYGSARGYMVFAQGRSTFYGSENMFDYSIATYEILETFADYLYLTHCEEDPYRNEHIYFWGPDTLDGKVHSNDTLFTQYGQGHWPRFMKRVTSCAPLVMPVNNQATFDEGFDPNADSIYFPDQADEIRTKSYRHNFGTFDPDSVTELTFHGREIYVRYCGPHFDDPDTVLKCLPEYIELASHFSVPPAVGALFVHGKVFIKASRGYVDLMDDDFESDGFEGRLTVANSDTMVIYDNLIYKNANPDNSVPISITDCLGLISEKCIMVGDSVRDTVYINAALAAINGTISVRDIYDYGTVYNPNNNEKQSLFIHGSLAMRNRGLVHTSYNGWGLRGFIEKDYHYDTRLQMNPPPHFIRTREHNVIYSESTVGGG
jgi:hypothetical protein